MVVGLKGAGAYGGLPQNLSQHYYLSSSIIFPREGEFERGWGQRVRLGTPSRGRVAYTEEVSRQVGWWRPGLAPVLVASLSQPTEMSPGSVGTWTVQG